jgi:CBS domain containing-hemolysin-like protein
MNAVVLADWQLWVALVSSWFLLGFLHCVEAAFLSVNDVRIRHRAEGGDPRARFLSQQLENREELLSILLFLTNLSSGLLAVAFLHLLADLPGDFWRVGILLVCVCAFFLFFAQRLPSVVGSRHADLLAVHLVWPFRHLQSGPLGLLYRLISGLVRSTGRFLGSPLAGVDPGFKFDEMGLLLEESEKRGVLDPMSHRMLRASLSLGEVTVERVMLPLDDVVMVGEEASVGEAAHVAAETGFSRLPIYSGERSQVVGYAHVIDLLVGGHKDSQAPVGERMQEILHILPEANLVSMLRLFRSSRYHMALVVTAEGEAVGLLTIEDVLENVVGDIEDEHDAMVGAIREDGESCWVTDPLVLLKDLAAVTGLEIPPGAYRTLGGYLTSLEKDSTEAGEALILGEYRVETEVEGKNSVARLRVIRQED